MLSNFKEEEIKRKQYRKCGLITEKHQHINMRWIFLIFRVSTVCDRYTKTLLNYILMFLVAAHNIFKFPTNSSFWFVQQQSKGNSPLSAGSGFHLIISALSCKMKKAKRPSEVEGSCNMHQPLVLSVCLCGVWMWVCVHGRMTEEEEKKKDRKGIKNIKNKIKNS